MTATADTSGTAPRTGHPVSGIGYERLAATGDLIAALEDRNAAFLVDVRESPATLRVPFAGATIAEACKATGIEYRHEPALGNPPWNRAGFAASGSGRDQACAAYRNRLEGKPARAALNRIWVAAGSGPVVILCREENEDFCHRWLILERLGTHLEVVFAPEPEREPEVPALFPK